jgi:CRP/FNR family transcriptional regulator, cyclic AMP receptor protein
MDVSAGFVRALAGAPVLKDVPPTTVEELAGRGALRRYAKGTYVFHQGDESTHVYFLWEGRVEVSSVAAGGQRQLRTTLDGPTFFGELGVLGEMPRTASALALEESTIWVIGADPFLGFLATGFDAVRALLRGLANQIQAHESFTEDLLFLDLKGRVAKRLLQLAAGSGGPLEDGAVITAGLTHSDLASLSGGTRENVTRILSEFQRRGLVNRDGRRYVLTDVAGLRRLANR